jgi:hypothetical protein
MTAHAELGPSPLHECQHLVPTFGIETVRRLVEQQQLGSWTSAWASLTRCFIPVE